MSIQVDLLLLEEGRAALQRQADDIKSARDRSAQVMTFAGGFAAFAGGIVFQGGGQTGPLAFTLALVGVMAFVVVGVCMTLVHRPRLFTFSNDVAKVYEEWELEKRDAREHRPAPGEGPRAALPRQPRQRVVRSEGVRNSHVVLRC